MLSATFHDWDGGADDPDFSVDLTRSPATFHTPKILYIIRRNCYTSQGDPDSSFPYLHTARAQSNYHQESAQETTPQGPGYGVGQKGQVWMHYTNGNA